MSWLNGFGKTAIKDFRFGEDKYMKNLKLFFLFSKFSLKTIFQARLGIVFFIMGKIFRFLFFFLLIVLILQKTRIIKGYTMDQVIIFYLTFNIVDTAAQILFREVYRFRQLVLSGNLDLILTKPFHPFLKILIGGVDFLDLVLLIPYLGLTFYFASKIATVYSLSSIVYSLLLLNSLFIATAFHIFVLAFGILTTDVDHTIMIYRDLTSLGRFPLEIYKEPMRGIFSFIIPIGVMMSFPPYALFNLLSFPLLVFAFLVSFLLFAFSIQLWNYALRKYQSYGG